MVAAAGVAVVDKKSFAEEREKQCNHHVRCFDGLFEVEMMVGRPVIRVVVAEGHDGERKKRENRLQENWAGKAGFRPTLRSIFSFSKA